MKGKILKIFITALLITNACLGIGCGGSISLYQLSAAARTAGPNESEIVITRPSRFVGAAIGFRVMVNGRSRLIVNNGKSGTIIVPNGRHIIYIEDKNFGIGNAASSVYEMNLTSARVILQAKTEARMGTFDIKITKVAEYPLDISNVPAVPQARPAPPPSGSSLGGMDGAIKNAVTSLMNDLPANSRLAVVNVTSNDNAARILDELEYLFVTSRRYAMIYRGIADDLRREKALKITGDITDNNLLGLGHVTGANVVITASVTAEGGANKLTMRALDVKAGRVIAMARESY